jgi:hypothetical protein
MTIISYTSEIIYSYKLQDNNEELDDKIISYFMKIKQKNKFQSSQHKNFGDTQSWSKKKAQPIERNQVSLLLNKLSNNNSKDIISQIIATVDDIENEQNIKSIIQDTFKVAIVQWQFCKLYVDLLDTLMKHVNNNSKYKNYILEQCKVIFDTYIIDIFEKAGQSYSDFCDNNMRKTKLFGCYQFIGELFNKDILSVLVIIDYIDVIICKLTEDDVDYHELYADCFNHLFLIIYKKLFSINSESIENVQSICNKVIVDKKIKARIRFIFMDILEIIKKNYKN